MKIFWRARRSKYGVFNHNAADMFVKVSWPRLVQCLRWTTATSNNETPSTYITTDLGVTGNAAAGMNELTRAEILRQSEPFRQHNPAKSQVTGCYSSQNSAEILQHPKETLTTVTASLSRDSPKTTMYNTSSTWISSKTASTATGSTADMRAEKRNISSIGVSHANRPVSPTAHRDMPGTHICETITHNV